MRAKEARRTISPRHSSLISWTESKDRLASTGNFTTDGLFTEPERREDDTPLKVVVGIFATSSASYRIVDEEAQAGWHFVGAYWSSDIATLPRRGERAEILLFLPSLRSNCFFELDVIERRSLWITFPRSFPLETGNWRDGCPVVSCKLRRHACPKIQN